MNGTIFEMLLSFSDQRLTRQFGEKGSSESQSQASTPVFLLNSFEIVFSVINPKLEVEVPSNISYRRKNALLVLV